MVNQQVIRNLTRGGGVGVVLMLFVVSGVSVLVGCDRTTDSSAEEVDENGGDESSDEAEATDDPSPYEEYQDVERLEPTDVGPEAPALYFVSGLKGYTEPCGCTVDVLLGGIDRITAYVRDVVELHPDALFVDAGDWLFEYGDIPEHIEPQERAKAEVLADAHDRMGTRFSVPGNRDLALGVDLYRRMMERAGMEPLGANISLGEEALQPAETVELEGDDILIVGAGEPETYEGVSGVEVGDPAEAIAGVVDERGGEIDTVVLLFQGSPFHAGELAEDIDEIDFTIVGHNPRLKEDARAVGSTRLVEAYDQGRYVGRLKLYRTDAGGPFEDGRAGVRDERDRIDTQIESVRRDLRRLEVRTEGEKTPMQQRLESRLEDLEKRRRQLLRDGIEIADDRPTFLYEPIAMEPGYRVDDIIERRRQEYNRSLADLIGEVDRDPLPVDDGDPFYVGQNECRDCHAQAYDFWEGTAHATAVETLERRDKQFDQNCIGCHVDGWEEPGGSVLGNIEYEAKLGDRTFDKDLHEVGCESCHGPGSNHLLDPLDDQGEPQHIIRRPGEQECTQCHVPDHSPTFDFDIYVDQITGEGHEYLSGQ